MEDSKTRGNHLNVKIGQTFGHDYQSSGLTPAERDQDSPEQPNSPLQMHQRDQADMVKSTDDAFIDPSSETKEISQLMIHKNELENITSYVAQKGRTVFHQFKTLLDE